MYRLRRNCKKRKGKRKGKWKKVMDTLVITTIKGGGVLLTIVLIWLIFLSPILIIDMLLKGFLGIDSFVVTIIVSVLFYGLCYYIGKDL